MEQEGMEQEEKMEQEKRNRNRTVTSDLILSKGQLALLSVPGQNGTIALEKIHTRCAFSIKDYLRNSASAGLIEHR